MKKLNLSILAAGLLLQSCIKQEPPSLQPLTGEDMNGAARISSLAVVSPLIIHTPDASHRDTYPRVIRMPNGNLLASFVYAPSEDFGHNPVKIYRSTNEGSTWTWISDLTDTHRSQGCSDPELFVLPVAIGAMPAGTLLCAIRSMFWVSTSYMDIYKSNDGGVTWSFLSSVAAGIGFNNNLYEPFLMIDNYGRLICYYTDERQGSGFKDKIVYQASTDGINWGAVAAVVDTQDPNDHMGMARVAKMGNGQFIMTYETNFPNPGSGVYYKFSNDGVNWGPPSDQGTRITGADGSRPHATPSVMWTPAGSSKGTVIVSGWDQTPASTRGSDNFVNYNYGAGSWYRVQQPLPYDKSGVEAGYSRCITPSADGNTLYHINCVNFTTTNARTMFAATPASYTPGYVYKIVNRNSNKVLGISGGSTEDMAKAAQGADNYAADQQWTIQASGTSGYVKIINKKSGKVLDILFGSTDNGAHAIQWPSSTATSQLWQVLAVGDGFYKLKNVGSGKLLGVITCSLDNGIVADQWDDNGALCQRWQLQHIE